MVFRDTIQFGGYLRRVYCITHVVTRTVGYIRDEVFVDLLRGYPLEQSLIFGFFAHDAADDADDKTHDADVLLFVEAADVVDFADAAVTQHHVYALGVVLDIKPVAHVVALAVHWQFFPSSMFLMIRGMSFSGKWYGP